MPISDYLSRYFSSRTRWVKQPDPERILDVHNPDPKKRHKKILGKTILWGLTYNPDDKRWEDGSIYDSRRGKVYRCQVTVQGPSKLLLRRFVGISLLGKTTTWTRSH